MTANELLVIDGSYGEGGGQIVRTSLSLAATTGRACRLVNIRANRKAPGLRPQHLTAVKASARICNARLQGAESGAREFSFFPGAVRSGGYEFNIGTAGSVTLVLQTLLPALARGEARSQVVITGGTHVPWSPPFHYLEQVFLPSLRRLGFRCEASLKRWGWYPQGGGEIVATIAPAAPKAPGSWDQPFGIQGVSALSASSRLPEHVRVRQASRIDNRLQRQGMKPEVHIQEAPALSPGSFVFLRAAGEHAVAGFSALGARGKPAEKVADEAVDDFFDFAASGAALDRHLADQILIYLAMIPGVCRIRTSAVTRHLLTNAWVVEQFLPVKFEVQGSLGEPGLVVKQDR